MAKPQKEITIYDIAKKLNISGATVSRALNDVPGINKQTKEKVNAAARELGYSFNAFASKLRTKRSNTIGVIVPRLNSNFMADVIAGIERVANEANFNLIISQSLEMVAKEITSAQTLFNNRIDGLLVSVAYDTGDIQHFEKFINRGIPLIFFDRVFEHPDCPNIQIDNFKAAYQVTDHLAKQGCKKIAHITATGVTHVYQDRFKGYLQAIQDNELTFTDELLITNNLSAQAGAEAAQQLMNMAVLPDGIFSANDVCAIHCMAELKKSGIKIPQDIAIVGFNNDPSCCITEPNLTSVNYNGEEMGELSARMLISELLNDDITTAHSLLLKHELMVRGSSMRM